MKHNTDKVYAHHYEGLYEKYVTRYRDTSVRLLEIGLGCGESTVGASALAWREYFGYKADIHFIEANEKCGKEWERTTGKRLNIKMHYGSQENETFLGKLKSSMQPFDIIIDDGGHTMNQQQVSFMKLLPLVKSGGLYVIEDLETSYRPRYGGGYLIVSTTIELIKTFIDDIQSESQKKIYPIAKKLLSFEIGTGTCFFTVK